MLNRLKGKEEPPSDLLERWLVWKLEDGVLKGLPYYRSLRRPGGECPERYARALLEDLRSASIDADARERIKDDGRAFRSWAERAPSVHSPHPGNDRGPFRTRGLAV